MACTHDRKTRYELFHHQEGEPPLDICLSFGESSTIGGFGHLPELILPRENSWHELSTHPWLWHDPAGFCRNWNSLWFSPYCFSKARKYPKSAIGLIHCKISWLAPRGRDLAFWNEQKLFRMVQFLGRISPLVEWWFNTIIHLFNEILGSAIAVPPY